MSAHHSAGTELGAVRATNAPPELPKPNRFADADNMPTLIYRTVGAASTCWTDAREFDMEQAIAIGDAAVERLIELGWNVR